MANGKLFPSFYWCLCTNAENYIKQEWIALVQLGTIHPANLFRKLSIIKLGIIKVVSKQTSMQFHTSSFKPRAYDFEDNVWNYIEI